VSALYAIPANDPKAIVVNRAIKVERWRAITNPRGDIHSDHHSITKGFADMTHVVWSPTAGHVADERGFVGSAIDEERRITIPVFGMQA
jgi:hypothetical protein